MQLVTTVSELRRKRIQSLVYKRKGFGYRLEVKIRKWHFDQSNATRKRDLYIHVQASKTARA